MKISYKKCRFTTFTHCLRSATMLAYALYLPFYYLSTLWPVHVTLLTRSCDDFHVTENGLGLRASLPIPTVQLHNYWTGLHTRVQALPLEWGGQSIAHEHQFYHSVTPPSYITISVLCLCYTSVGSDSTAGNCWANNVLEVDNVDQSIL